MSKHNNIYNILGKLSALEPKPEPAKSILNELATPSKSDFARHLNERYLAEKDKGMSRAAKGYEKYGKQGMEALAKAGKAGKDLDPIRKKYDKYDNTEVEEGWKGALAGGIAGAGLGSVVPGLGTLAGGIAGAYAGHKIGDQGISDPDSAPSRTASPQRNAPIKMTAADRLAMPSGPRKASFQKTVADVDEDMLSPKQKKIAGLRPPPGKIDANDLAALRAGKTKEKEGNEFSGELAKAKAQHKDSFSVDGKEYPVKEDSHDPANRGEYDREGEMADQDLETAQDAAQELRSILDADENLPEWVQAKITKAVDYLDTARDYMQSKDSEAVTEGVAKQAFVILDTSLIDQISPMDGTEVDPDNDVVWSTNPNVTAKLMAFARKNPQRLKVSSSMSGDNTGARPAGNQWSQDSSPDLQEGWDDMMKSVKDRAEQGTGKFDKQTTSTGTRYTRKADTFADAGDDGETKASDGPKKKGRPKKNTGPERVTAKAYKHKGGRVSESVKLDTFVEDTLAEMDAMLTTTKSVAQPQKFMGMVSESILLENTLQAIEHRYGKEVREFMETGELDDDLYHALYDYYFDDMPYGVKKARDGDPYEWIGDRFFDEMGGAGYLNRKDNSNGIEESGALHPGQVVYYRGERGEIDRIEGNKCFVHVGDGDMDVWPTNSCSTDKQSFMSTMKNDIKDIGHGMKGFLTGGSETRELDELARLAGLGQQKLGEASCNMTAEGEMCAKHGFAECWSSSMYESKGEKPDFLDMDKDGDKEESMKKATDDKKKPAASNAYTQTSGYPSFKKKNPFGNKKDLEECGMPGSMSPMGSMAPEAESGMSINSSMDTKTGRKTLSVTADGAAAEQLAQMLKMAGMAGGHSHEVEPEHHKAVIIRPIGQDMEQPVEEEYANEPNEQYVSNDALMNQGQDLNRKKKQYAGMPKAGDNPMATEDAVRLEGKLARLYDSIKVRN